MIIVSVELAGRALHARAVARHAVGNITGAWVGGRWRELGAGAVSWGGGRTPTHYTFRSLAQSWFFVDLCSSQPENTTTSPGAVSTCSNCRCATDS